MKSTTAFYIGEYEVTKRELMAVPAIIGTLLIIGFVISGRIDRSVQARNLKYHTAVHIVSEEDFKDRLESDNRFAFASGHLVAVNPISFESAYLSLRHRPFNMPSGTYLQTRIEREHYTRHTRTVTETVNGKSKTKTEVYYTWDTVEKKADSVKSVIFNGVELSAHKFDMRFSMQQIDFMQEGNDRWYFYAYKKEYDGIVFTELANQTISDSSPFYIQYASDIDALETHLTSTHELLIFWIIWSVLTLALVVAFVCIDNKWLEG